MHETIKKTFTPNRKVVVLGKVPRQLEVHHLRESIDICCLYIRKVYTAAQQR